MWRFDDQRLNGVLVHEYIARAIVASSRCISIDIRGYFIEIAQGDVLGVRMFKDGVLPVVGNIDQDMAPLILHIGPSQYSTSINRIADGVILSTNVIHLTANIVAVATTTEARQGTNIIFLRLE